MEKIMNLKEKIYLLTYGQPNYFTKISQILYGEEKKQLFPILKELKNDNWIEEIDNKSNLLSEDGRSIIGRKYYQAHVEPLLNNICSDLNKKNRKLTENEINRLKKLLNSNIFKLYVKEVIDRTDFKNHLNGFSLIKTQLCCICSFHSVYSRLRSIATDEDLWDYIDDVSSNLISHKDSDPFSRENGKLVRGIINGYCVDAYIYSSYEEYDRHVYYYDELEIKKNKTNRLFLILDDELSLLGIPLIDKIALLDENIPWILQTYMSRYLADTFGDPFEYDF